MPSSCLEERLTNTLIKNRIYRFLFILYTGIFDIKNLIIKREIRKWSKNKNPKTTKIFDIGFGFGQQLQYLYNIIPDANIFGIDLSERAVACVNSHFNFKKYPKIYCKQEDITTFEGNETFDLAVAVNLLNYVESDDKAIKNIYDALKPKGTLLLVNHYSQKESNDIKKSFDDIHLLPIVRNGYTMPTLRDKLKEAGFSTVKCRYIYGNTGFWAWKLAIGLPSKWLKNSNLFLLVFPFYILFLSPLIFFLNFYDMQIGHTAGHSIFLKAEK
jgi:SAM-dependent methyltransferase